MSDAPNNAAPEVAPRSQQTDHLLIFIKHPVPGYSKTRLISSQGEYAAAEISRLLTEHTILTARSLQYTDPRVRVLIHHANPDHVPQSATAAWLRPNSREDLIAQITYSNSLGDRLMNAVKHSFEQPYPAQKVVVTGTDSPDITTHLLQQAFQKLDHADVVIGPAFDGGYYLLGMKMLLPALFQGIQWSTKSVCADTIQKASDLQLTVEKLQPLNDIDELEDLLHLPSSKKFEFESKGVFGKP